MESGIYLIRNIVNDKKYIGSTVSFQGFKIRWRRHKTQLNGGYHANLHLQASWKKYGEENFEFTILEICQDDLLITREQKWIDHFISSDNKYGYNLREAGSHGRHSEETKRKISESQKIRWAKII
jgi:group I intron endonuclease